MNDKNESELTVITRAKECCSYVLQITDLAPKKYRYTLLGKMQMYSLDIIEYLNYQLPVILAKVQESVHIFKGTGFLPLRGEYMLYDREDAGMVFFLMFGIL